MNLNDLYAEHDCSGLLLPRNPKDLTAGLANTRPLKRTGFELVTMLASVAKAESELVEVRRTVCQVLGLQEAPPLNDKDSTPIEDMDITATRALELLEAWADDAELRCRRCLPGEEEPHHNRATNYRRVHRAIQAVLDGEAKKERLRLVQRGHATHVDTHGCLYRFGDDEMLQFWNGDAWHASDRPVTELKRLKP